jgi:Fe-Mn family superoxide dismutase
MSTIQEYSVQEQLKPSELEGISNEQINDHWNLYAGYVKQTNALNQEMNNLSAEGQQASLAFADRRRRYGFEYNGMVLHEYYFGNLQANYQPLAEGQLKKAFATRWDSFDKWQEDFANAGKTRGIGWAIVYADTTTGQLTNHFIQEHENGNIAGFAPIVVMDVWEHAYMVDHKAGGRADYINAFLKNVSWSIIEKRYNDALEGKISSRF